MNEGLEALHHPRIKSARVDISAEGKHDIAYMRFDDTKQYTAIENELKEYEMEHTLRVRLENINYELVREKQENEKKLKALEIISKAYGDYANHRISEYELIMIIGENTNY